MYLRNILFGYTVHWWVSSRMNSCSSCIFCWPLSIFWYILEFCFCSFILIRKFKTLLRFVHLSFSVLIFSLLKFALAVKFLGPQSKTRSTLEFPGSFFKVILGVPWIQSLIDPHVSPQRPLQSQTGPTWLAEQHTPNLGNRVSGGKGIKEMNSSPASQPSHGVERALGKVLKQERNSSVLHSHLLSVLLHSLLLKFYLALASSKSHCCCCVRRRVTLAKEKGVWKMVF